jgi:hypothetical protein
MLQNAAGLLRLPLGHAARRLHVLRDAEQHPRLLRLLLRKHAALLRSVVNPCGVMLNEHTPQIDSTSRTKCER